MALLALFGMLALGTVICVLLTTPLLRRFFRRLDRGEIRWNWYWRWPWR